MVKRPTIADLARKAGVSVATVDRVLNRRLPVRDDTVLRVVEAAEAIGYHATGLLKRRMTEAPPRRFAFLLQKPDAFYTLFGKELVAATKSGGAGNSRSVSGGLTVSWQLVQPVMPPVHQQQLELLNHIKLLAWILRNSEDLSVTAYSLHL